MLSENIVFKDLHKVQIITPYRQLRNLKGWTQDYAADRLCISKRLLIDVELGHCDCPKSVVRIMDREYGCGGQLIDYWLTKFSVSHGDNRIWEMIRRALP
mgnify:CR=1 FL=1